MVVVPAFGAVLGLGGHNGGSSFGVVGLGIIAQPRSVWLNLRLVKEYACTIACSLSWLSKYKKKDP